MKDNPQSVDPFLQLHKMSTTAGLGSGDYVAINAAAVMAILLGAASATVLFNSLIFLIFPALALFAGILAWMQISKSNGTQTGRGVAAIGLLLAVGFGGFAGIRAVYGSYRNHSDEEQIVAQVHKLGELLKAQDYTNAYQMFDAQFHKHVSRSDFEAGWRRLSASPYLGNVRGIDWNNLLSFQTDPVDESRLASGMMLMQLNPKEPMRIHMSFRDEEGSWLIDLLPEIFTTDASGAASAQQPRPKSSSLIGPPKP